jgi:hypothetical protein
VTRAEGPDGLKLLDFLVIGAAKSGTTTLFHLLRHHPEIAMPADKEAPFFTRDPVYERGWSAYAADHFAGADPALRWGKVTPRYMGDNHVPARIAATMPQVRLLALLRNPIDRAESKYRMLLRRGSDVQPFPELVRDQLDADRLAAARTGCPRLDESIVARGEYGRIIADYREHFAADRVAVHFTEELDGNPQGLVDDVLAFIGLPGPYEPPNLGERYHEGGDARRFPNLTRRMQRTPLRSGFRMLSPSIRRRVRHWYSTEANISKATKVELSDDETRAMLRQFYAPDVRRLEELIGKPVPWPEFAAAESASPDRSEH